jgi:hypothetical protein
MSGVVGTRNYGKVDHVPGVFYVATQFFHINFVPVLPLTTYVVLDGSEGFLGLGAFRGKKIRMSLKSVLTAYSRATLLISVAITGLIAAIKFFDGFPTRDAEKLTGCGVLAGVAVACGVMYWLTYRVSRASEARALQLADELGLSHALVLKCLGSTRSALDIPELERAPADDGDYDDCREAEADYNRRDY